MYVEWILQIKLEGFLQDMEFSKFILLRGHILQRFFAGYTLMASGKFV